MTRLDDLIEFYSILDDLAARRGLLTLGEHSSDMVTPQRGVYFFLDKMEARTGSGHGCRVVRVGTHALKQGSGTTLWSRLKQHYGVGKGGGGNHRGSIFRLLVGVAMAHRDGLSVDSWGVGSTRSIAARRLGVDSSELREKEHDLEVRVSNYIRDLYVLWIAIEDEPGPGSMRAYIERNTIALLSNYAKAVEDPASAKWLGRHCDRLKVRESGLWNNNHVDENYDPGVKEALSALLEGKAWLS